jgi:hypothetical protein
MSTEGRVVGCQVLGMQGEEQRQVVMVLTGLIELRVGRMGTTSVNCLKRGGVWGDVQITKASPPPLLNPVLP